MNPIAIDSRRSSARDPALNVCWTLDAGRALTLSPAAAGVLRIAQGRVWVTLDGPHERLAGDLFLEAGAELSLQAGRRAVLEPIGAAGQAPAAAFNWVQDPVSPAAHWRAAVAQPASELRLALGSAGLALRGAALALLRLAGGLLGLIPAGLGIAMDRVARRDRPTVGVVTLNAQSGARCPQGCMN